MELLFDPTLKEKGVVLFETVLVLCLGVTVIFGWHIFHAHRFRKELIELQAKRIPYDGVRRWKN